MIPLDDDRLALVLTSVGEHLELDDRPRSSRLGPWLAAAAALLVAVTLAFAPVRDAVAGWLGVGSTRVTIDPALVPSSLAGIDDRLMPVSRARAEAVVELPDVDGTDLGPPSGFALMPEGGALVVWPDGSTLWVHDAELEPGVWLEKVVASGSQVEELDDLGDGGLVIVGDHFLRTPHRTVEAATTVLWVLGDQEFRLESDRPADELTGLARQLTP